MEEKLKFEIMHKIFKNFPPEQLLKQKRKKEGKTH